MNTPKSKAQLDEEKETVARAAIAYVQEGMVVGLGSGTTAERFIAQLAERVRVGHLNITGVPSSLRVASLSLRLGIPLAKPSRGLRLDLDVDGADQIGPDLALIKGGGGALVREKILARAARRFLVIADSSKVVSRLGGCPLPVEVLPFAVPFVSDWVSEMGASVTLRMVPGTADEPFLSDQNNYILDCIFPDLSDSHALAARLDELPGLVDHGLFLGYAHVALVADGSGVRLLHSSGASGDLRTLPRGTF